MTETIKSEREEWLDSIDVCDPVMVSIGGKSYSGLVAGFDSHWENRAVYEVRVSYTDEKGNDSEQTVPLYSGKLDQVRIDPHE